MSLILGWDQGVLLKAKGLAKFNRQKKGADLTNSTPLRDQLIKINWLLPPDFQQDRYLS